MASYGRAKSPLAAIFGHIFSMFWGFEPCLGFGLFNRVSWVLHLSLKLWNWWKGQVMIRLRLQMISCARVLMGFNKYILLWHKYIVSDTNTKHKTQLWRGKRLSKILMKDTICFSFGHSKMGSVTVRIFLYIPSMLCDAFFPAGKTFSSNLQSWANCWSQSTEKEK